jgi:hypothetical protein
MLSISVGSVEDIVKNHLHYRKVNARWVPRTLTDVTRLGLEPGPPRWEASD